MSTYPPGPSTSSRFAVAEAEEFELSDVPLAGPSRTPEVTPTKRGGGRRSSQAKSVRSGRIFTIPSAGVGDNGDNILFAAPGYGGPGGSSSTGVTPVNAAHGPGASPVRARPTRNSRTYSFESVGGTPRGTQWASFLDEHHDGLSSAGGGGTGMHGAAHATRTDQVEVPDFGHMLGFNPDDDDHYAVAAGMRNRWKRKLYLLMEEPGSGREAFFIHVLVTGSILFSAILTTFSTLPSFHTDPASVKMLFGLDTFLVVLFTVEYMARSLAHSGTLNQYYNWATSFFPLIDLLAILPYYIEVARGQDTSILFRFSILRTLRLLRVFRAFKYQNQMLLTIEVMYVAVHRSKDALIALSYFIILVLVLFSTLIYFAERGTWDAVLGAFVDADGDPSLFDSIPQTAWFALVTMATVGYGDVVPRSFLGKMLTVPLLMFGLLLIALPSFVLGRNFAIVFDAMNRQALKAPSIIDTPRVSAEGDRPEDVSSAESQQPPISTVPDRLAQTLSTSASPYLPLANGEPTATYPAPPSKRSSPNPATLAGASRAVQPKIHETTPRMWDGSFDGPQPEGKTRSDLSNVKLAKNQMVLSDQIRSMRKQIDRQSDLINQLVAALSAGQHGQISAQARPPMGLGLLDGETVANGGTDSGSRDSGHRQNGVPPRAAPTLSNERKNASEPFVLDDDDDDDDDVGEAPEDGQSVQPVISEEVAKGKARSADQA